MNQSVNEVKKPVANRTRLSGQEQYTTKVGSSKKTWGEQLSGPECRESVQLTGWNENGVRAKRRAFKTLGSRDTKRKKGTKSTVK